MREPASVRERLLSNVIARRGGSAPRCVMTRSAQRGAARFAPLFLLLLFSSPGGAAPEYGARLQPPTVRPAVTPCLRVQRTVGGWSLAPYFVRTMERWSIELAKEYFKFSAAHFLIFPDGSSERLHGHNYRVRVEIEASLTRHGLVLDFK